MTNNPDAKNDVPIDFAEVLERIGGDAVFLEDLLRIYFEELDQKRRHLDEAIAQADFGLLQDLGHSLKGASANLSLGSLQRASLALEKAGRNKSTKDARRALDWLLIESERLKDFLRQNPPRTHAAGNFS